MFSIIVCSIRPEEADALNQNIRSTIGVPYEFIAYDNRNSGKGLCQVYNECAEKAKYDNLCFVHEDVEFLSEDWGKIIAEKLCEDDCGVIGFAGSIVKPKVHTGWYTWKHKVHRKHYIQCGKNKEYICSINPDGTAYSKVVTLDGMCLMCTKKTWADICFDDNLLKNFHCYDIDFTLGSHFASKINYVCNLVLIKHRSGGNMDYKWWLENEIMHQKWENRLPVWTTQTSYLRKVCFEFSTQIKYNKFLADKGLHHACKVRFVLLYWLIHPFNIKAINMLGGCLKYKAKNKA